MRASNCGWHTLRQTNSCFVKHNLVVRHLTAPLDRIILGDGKTERMRRLDYEYQVESLASSSVEIADFERKALVLQAKQAVVSIEQLRHQRTSSEALKSISDAFPGIAQSIEKLSEGALEVKSAIDGLSANLESQFQELAEIAFEQKVLLHQITASLSSPYQTQVKELRNEATKWLESGMGRQGRDRQEDWADATRLLVELIRNPIGMQDYTAWFQIGYLHWKNGNDLEAAEDAFYRSQRLSESTANAFYIKGLRHLAHIKYLRGDFSGAEEVQLKAALLKDDLEIQYDLARYKSKTGKAHEAANLLKTCLRQRTSFYVSMFSEEDFLED